MFCVPLGKQLDGFARPLAARLRVVGVSVGIGGGAALDGFQRGALEIVVLEVVVGMLGHDLVRGCQGIAHRGIGLPKSAKACGSSTYFSPCWYPLLSPGR